MLLEELAEFLRGLALSIKKSKSNVDFAVHLTMNK